MADNFAVTAGAGTIIGTDEVAGSVHIQKIKLVDGTADSVALIPGDATNGLDVDVTRISALVAGTALIGKVGIDQVTANANEVVVKSGTVTAVTAITNALPAGTNAIGKLAANSGVDIGDVDVTSMPVTHVIADSGTVTTVSTVSAVTAVGTITPGVAATSLGKAEDAAHSSGDVGVEVLAVRADTLAPTGANSDYVPLLTDANGALWVSLGTKLDSTNDSVTAVGGAAQGAAVSGNPVLIGAKALSADQAAVDTGDAVAPIADLVGKQVVMPYAINQNFISGATAKIEVDTVISLIAAQAAGIRIYVTSLLVTNSDATVGSLVEIRDGTTTILWRGYAAPAGGGFACAFPVPLRGTAATALNVYCMTASAEVYVSASGYIGV